VSSPSTTSEVRSFASVEEAESRLEQVGYLPSPEIATACFLADRMGKPILVEGPAGVGKTELSKALAQALGREFIRLQCYEGLDEAKALYEWEYAKQLLYTQLLKDKIGEMVAGTGSLRPAVLLVDEIDKADPEFEAFLLEVLADNAVTIPELGTFQARHIPRVILTSNNARELSDALKRRCLHLHIDFPDRERELRIVRARLPQVSQTLAEQVIEAVAAIRTLDLKKAPSISETLDWAQSLALLNADVLSADVVAATLNVVLKHEGDIEKARGSIAQIAQG